MIERARREEDFSYFEHNWDWCLVKSCVSSLQREIRFQSLTRFDVRLTLEDVPYSLEFVRWIG